MSETNLIETIMTVTNLSETNTTMTNLVTQTSDIVTNTTVWGVFKFIGNNTLFVLIAATVVCICWKLFRSIPKFDEMLHDDVLRTLDPKSETLADGKLKSDETLRAIADALIAGQPILNMPSSVLRIEYEVKKITDDKVQLTVITIHQRGNDTVQRKAERIVAWIDMPKKIRARFIKENRDSLWYSLFDRTESESSQ